MARERVLVLVPALLLVPAPVQVQVLLQQRHLRRLSQHPAALQVAQLPVAEHVCYVERN